MKDFGHGMCSECSLVFVNDKQIAYRYSVGAGVVSQLCSPCFIKQSREEKATRKVKRSKRVPVAEYVLGED